MDLLYAKWYSMSTYLVLKTRLYIYDNLFWIEKAEAFIFFNVRMNKKGHNVLSPKFGQKLNRF